MKKPALFLLLASTLIASVAHAAPEAGWDAKVRQFDDAYWAAYNRCDLKALSTMNADDLEFFHDLGGAMRGKAQFDAAMARNICGNPSNKVRREAIPGSVQVYPMMANGVLYGAVIEGAHRFYNAAQGTPEVLSENARFTSLLVLQDGVWKLARALSFAHTPARPEAKLAEVKAAPQSLDLLTGTYTAKDKMVLTVKPEGNGLMVRAGGSAFALYPTGVHTFAMKERDITVSFMVDANGRGQALVVRERGAIVAEAAASN